MSVTLWHLRTDPPPLAEAAALSLLDAGERARHRAFAGPEPARAFLLRRALRRAVLGHLLGRDPAALAFRETPEGRPVLDLPGAPAFSVSDTGGLAVLATGAPGTALGADVERARPGIADRLGPRVLSPAERLVLAPLDPPARDRAFAAAWTLREAVLKATGLGFHAAPSLDDLALIAPGAPSGPPGWRRIDPAGRLAPHGTWHVWQHALDPETPVALAAREPGPVVLRDAAPLLAGLPLP